MSDSVGQYLNEIGAVALLTAQEERELSQVIERGVAARERIAAGEGTAEDRRLDRAITDRLVPGGLLAISVLSAVGAAPGPFRAEPGELRAAFADLTVIAAGEGDGEAWLLARRAPLVDRHHE